MSLDGKWNDFLDAISDGVEELAKNTLKGFVSEAKADAQSFADFSRDKVELWARAVAEGKIDRDDFEFLMSGLKSLAKLHTLTAKGIAAKRLDDFRQGLISLFINTVFDLI